MLLREQEQAMYVAPEAWALIAGLVLGLAAGFTARSSAFCTLGAIADAVVGGNHRRLRAWALALAVAMIGSQALHHLSLLDLGASIYLQAPFSALAILAGGWLFGLGMALVGTCGFGTLIRFGGGDLRALVDMACLGFFAYLTLSGPLAYLRVALVDATDLAMPGAAPAGLIDVAAEILALPVADVRPFVIVPIIGVLLLYSLSDAGLRRRPKEMLAALAIGLVIPLGWLATGYLGHDPFAPEAPASLTFVRPIGDGFLYMMLMSGMRPTFGVATVAGVMIGALIAARAAAEWRVEGFDGEREMIRHLAGAALMGIGGVLALGCTIGQGMSAMSTLALSAPLALIAIFLGAVCGLRYLEEGSLMGVLRVLTGRYPS
ncbi:MAG: YeeE/YedE family protein [Geminicoccaceae bacterium]